MNKKFTTSQITLLGLMIAILLLMAYTPLGYLNIGPLAITFNIIPVAISAITMGPVGGAIAGAVFGLTSFGQCIGIGGTSLMGVTLFGINPFLAFVQRFIPRLVDGLLLGYIFQGVRRKSKNIYLSCAVTGFLSAFLNTLFFMGLLVGLFVYRCINRLDRDTTGALILAKNPYSAAVLSAQMKQRQIRRTYLAIVQGIAPEQGTIDAPIGRAADSTIERQVDFANGESAVTHYERLATYHSYSLIELHLETGRTHQIRVHMKYIGHPLPGDFLYNPDYRIIKRQPLHSFQLEFAHPVTGENMCITAPVPEDFADAFHRS